MSKPPRWTFPNREPGPHNANHPFVTTVRSGSTVGDEVPRCLTASLDRTSLEITRVLVRSRADFMLDVEIRQKRLEAETKREKTRSLQEVYKRIEELEAAYGLQE